MAAALKCACRTCSATARDDSNFCEKHQPQLPSLAVPTPPPGSMIRDASARLPAMFFMGTLLLVAVWSLDDLRAWTRTWFSASSYARTACPAPRADEQLLIVVERGTKLGATCMYVGAGSHARRPVRQVAAQ